MAKANRVSKDGREKSLTRRRFLQGAAVGGAGVRAASVLSRRVFMEDPNRPPKLYERALQMFSGNPLH